MDWNDTSIHEFYVDGVRKEVASGSILTLRLKAASSTRAITYIHEMHRSQQRLLFGENELAALTFHNLAIRDAHQASMAPFDALSQETDLTRGMTTLDEDLLT